ncbi:lasso peptide biosynthesis B2 protein [Erythrobacter sp. HKB08]|uniref:lasso peptide biosynthesis B2 protein n=1 Tax=Erythrobacter sp. HKB08 TaxID=2502843 RepID=UPI0013E8D0F6|nr:lasso peptide biosynthesis B2 protein [Erythrobacter sp. HKB08]
MPKLKTMASMPRAEWAGYAEAMACLLWARLLVLLVPLKHWRKHIADGIEAKGTLEPLDESEREAVKLVARSISRAVRNTPVELICLPQALAARWMLARRGVATQLYLGTRMAAEEDREFHAWLKAGRTWVTGHCDEENFVTFERRTA